MTAPTNSGGRSPAAARSSWGLEGIRLYFSNSLYAAWDEQFYPEGIRGWVTKADVNPDGGIVVDPDFFIEFSADERPHQIRLEGGDSSSDSYCYPS